MDKEIKVVKKTTSKRTRKPKTVEIVEEIVDDVIEEDVVEVEEAIPKKSYKQLKQEILKF